MVHFNIAGIACTSAPRRMSRYGAAANGYHCTMSTMAIRVFRFGLIPFALAACTQAPRLVLDAPEVIIRHINVVDVERGVRLQDQLVAMRDGSDLGGAPFVYPGIGLQEELERRQMNRDPLFLERWDTGGQHGSAIAGCALNSRAILVEPFIHRPQARTASTSPR